MDKLLIQKFLREHCGLSVEQATEITDSELELIEKTQMFKWWELGYRSDVVKDQVRKAMFEILESLGIIKFLDWLASKNIIKK